VFLPSCQARNNRKKRRTKEKGNLSRKAFVNNSARTGSCGKNRADFEKCSEILAQKLQKGEEASPSPHSTSCPPVSQRLEREKGRRERSEASVNQHLQGVYEAKYGEQPGRKLSPVGACVGAASGERGKAKTLLKE